MGLRCLCIGVSEYGPIRLPRVATDVGFIRGVLEEIGGQVTTVCSLDYTNKTTLHKIVSEFIADLADGDYVVIFLSGPGANFADENYLLPCDFPVHSTNFASEALNIGKDIVGPLAQSRARVSFIAMDLCVSAPDSSGGGKLFALKAMPAPRKTIISYACTPGRESFDCSRFGIDSDTSLYVWCLASNIKFRDDVQFLADNVSADVFKFSKRQQLPWHHLSLPRASTETLVLVDASPRAAEASSAAALRFASRFSSLPPAPLLPEVMPVLSAPNRPAAPAVQQQALLSPATIKVDDGKKSTIQIFYNDGTGKKTMLEVDQSDDIESVKKKIQDKEGIQTIKQRIFFGGHELEGSCIVPKSRSPYPLYGLWGLKSTADAESCADLKSLKQIREFFAPVTLQYSHIIGSVLDTTASLECIQSFQTGEDEAAAGIFFLPLSWGAAVRGLELQVGSSRIVRAVVKERAVAQAVFVAAAEAQALRTEQSEDVYRLDLGRLPARTKVTARLLFNCALYCDSDCSQVKLNLVIPLALLHRYDLQRPLFCAPGVSSSGSTDTPAPKATEDTNVARIRAAPASGLPPALPVTARIQVRNRFGVCSIWSPSHGSMLSAAALASGDGCWTAELALSADFCNDSAQFKDFVLQVDVPAGCATSGVFAWTEVSSAPLGVSRVPSHSAMLEVSYDWCRTKLALAPVPASSVNTAPPEFLFVVDCSGSMRGDPIDCARKALLFALRSMPAGSLFNVLRFGTQTRLMLNSAGTVVDSEIFESSTPLPLVPLSNKSLAAAKCAIFVMEADLDGSTELLPALCAALNRAPATAASRASMNAERVVVLLTGGRVSNARQVIAKVRDCAAASSTRIFTLSVGAHGSRALMEGVAMASNASHAYIADGERAEREVSALMRAALEPAVSVCLSVASVPAASHILTTHEPLQVPPDGRAQLYAVWVPPARLPTTRALDTASDNTLPLDATLVVSSVADGRVVSVPISLASASRAADAYAPDEAVVVPSHASPCGDNLWVTAVQRALRALESQEDVLLLASGALEVPSSAPRNPSTQSEAPPHACAVTFADGELAKLAQLRRDIVDLSTRFGIISRHTAFVSMEVPHKCLSGEAASNSANTSAEASAASPVFSSVPRALKDISSSVMIDIEYNDPHARTLSSYRIEAGSTLLLARRSSHALVNIDSSAGPLSVQLDPALVARDAVSAAAASAGLMLSPAAEEKELKVLKKLVLLQRGDGSCAGGVCASLATAAGLDMLKLEAGKSAPHVKLLAALSSRPELSRESLGLLRRKPAIKSVWAALVLLAVLQLRCGGVKSMWRLMAARTSSWLCQQAAPGLDVTAKVGIVLQLLDSLISKPVVVRMATALDPKPYRVVGSASVPIVITGIRLPPRVRQHQPHPRSLSLAAFDSPQSSTASGTESDERSRASPAASFIFSF